MELTRACGGGGFGDLVPLHPGGGGGGHFVAAVTPDNIEHPAADLQEKWRKGGSNQTRKIGGPEGSAAKAGRRADLESVARLASHELEGAVDEGARVAEGGAVVVHHHNVEQLRRGHGAVAGDRRQKRRWRGRPGGSPFPFSLLVPGPVPGLVGRFGSDSVGQLGYSVWAFSCRARHDTAAFSFLYYFYSSNLDFASFFSFHY